MKKVIDLLQRLNFLKPSPPQHLGRWRLDNKNYIKTDYANMDSCGDILCGKPDHFKKIKTSIQSN